MRRAAALVVLAALATAGCGGAAKKQVAPKAPRLPRALAQTWAQQADGVASALAAGDGCTAQRLAGTLRGEVVQAVNAHRVGRAFQEQLLASANDIAARITCNPAPPPPPKHGHEHKHKDHHGDGGGD